MTKEQLEKRSFELRVQNSDSRLITGKAICFDSMSEDLGFREIISKGAITQELIDSSDIYFTFNHSMDKVLARWNKGEGSLKIELKDDGVYFSTEAPNTDLGNEVLEYIRRGDANKC